MKTKREIAALYPQMKPIGHLGDPDLTLVIYEHEHPHLLGMKFTKGKAPRPFLAKIQPKGSFVVSKTYFAIDKIKYDPSTPKEDYIYPNAKKMPSIYQTSLEERVNKTMMHGHALILQDDNQLIEFIHGLMNKKYLTLNQYVEGSIKSSDDDPLANNILTVKHMVTKEIEEISERDLKTSACYEYNDVIKGTPLDAPKPSGVYDNDEPLW